LKAQQNVVWKFAGDWLSSGKGYGFLITIQ